MKKALRYLKTPPPNLASDSQIYDGFADVISKIASRKLKRNYRALNYIALNEKRRT